MILFMMMVGLAWLHGSSAANVVCSLDDPDVVVINAMVSLDANLGVVDFLNLNSTMTVVRGCGRHVWLCRRHHCYG